MPTFAVRFKGMLTKDELEWLERAGVTIEGQEPSIQIGGVATGAPIYTVHVEADSADEALQKVRDALDPDTGNFSNWEAGPA
jgi:hypothetical protein